MKRRSILALSLAAIWPSWSAKAKAAPVALNAADAVFSADLELKAITFGVVYSDTLKNFKPVIVKARGDVPNTFYSDDGSLTVEWAPTPWPS